MAIIDEKMKEYRELLEPRRAMTRAERAVLQSPEFAGSIEAYKTNEVDYKVKLTTEQKELFKNHITTRARILANPPLLIAADPRVGQKNRPSPISWVQEHSVFENMDEAADEAGARERNKYYPHQPHAVLKACNLHSL